jgi:hypothetical protein
VVVHRLPCVGWGPRSWSVFLPPDLLDFCTFLRLCAHFEELLDIHTPIMSEPPSSPAKSEKTMSSRLLTMKVCPDEYVIIATQS